MATDIPRIHKWFVRNAQSQAHEQLDTWTNAWHDKNTL